MQLLLTTNNQTYNHVSLLHLRIFAPSSTSRTCLVLTYLRCCRNPQSWIYINVMILSGEMCLGFLSFQQPCNVLVSLSTCVITSLITIITLSRTRDIQVAAADSFLNSLKYVFCSWAASFRTFFIITGEGEKDSKDLIYRILDNNNLQLGNTTLGGLIKRPKGCLCVCMYSLPVL